MSLYARYILPWLIHLVMQNSALVQYRHEIAAAARGRVLEIGLGSGLNLPYYTSQVEHLYGVEPSPALVRLAQKQTTHLPFGVELLTASAEALALQDNSIDTLVSTWTLCSIADVATALQEMRRVLTPAGRVLFAEHGLSPDASVAAWQQRLTPLWRPIAGGCHLDRPIDQLLRQAGFTLTDLHTRYLDGPRPWTYFYWGQATI